MSIYIEHTIIQEIERGQFKKMFKRVLSAETVLK